MVKPNFALPEQQLSSVEERSLRSENMEYVGHKDLADFAYKTTNNKPGFVVFRITSPEILQEVTAAARFRVRVPPPADSDFKLELSTNEGKSWQPLGKANIPADNQYSSGWMYGKADVTTAKTKTALVKVHVYQGGYATGIQNVRAYGIYQTSSPQEAVVTYGWKEGAESRTHTETIAADHKSHTFKVPTGDEIVDEFVSISAN